MKIEGNAQGTNYHITYYDAQNRNFQPEIVQLLKDFDLSVSTYIPNSIISRINSNEKNVIVDKYFKACFKKAKEVWKNTKGAFDPTVYPLVNAYGFGPGKKQKLEKYKIDSILNFVGFQLIELKGNQVIKKDPRVALDFNAFAQGYSVDVVSDFLNSKGIDAYIVEIGGEVYAHGRNSDGSNWKIGIEKPIDNKETVNPLKAIAKLEDMAVATSGNYRRFTMEDGVKYVHHIDPKTGYPTKNNLLSASIFAKKCMISDAYATGILVLGLEKAKVFLTKHPELQAYLIYSDDYGNYQVYETPGLKTILSESAE
ncbi:MAG TPA: FAD:protein FMN transferase [Flavobacterium sp.]|nr:FAD:protein FMN transferase [Flavobacterium sp.]